MKDNDKFRDHNLTGFPSWYLSDHPVDEDAAFPLSGYVTKKLPHPHDTWRSDFSLFSAKVAKKNAPRVPLAVRLASFTVAEALRLMLTVFLVLSLFSVVVGSGFGLVYRSFVPVEETVVSVSLPDGLSIRSGGGSGTPLLDDCYQRFSMPHGRWIKVCY